MIQDPRKTADSTAAAPNLVEVRQVHFSLGKRVIYKAIDLDIARGRITAIMGPSGTGKTTLLRLISGQWRPASGTVLFDGQHVAKLGQGELFEQRKRMGMLFQSGALLTDLSVFDNVAFPLREHTRLPERLIRDIVLMKLEAVGCAARARCIRPSCPAAWPAAWRWPVRSPWIRK